MHVDLLRRLLEESGAAELYEPLAALLERLIERYRPLAVILAGSLAEGRFVRGLSDIDVLLVVEGGVGRLDRFRLYAVGDVDVEVTLVSLGELVEAVRGCNPFYRSALCRGVVVYGEAETVSRLKGELCSGRRGACG